MKKHIGLFCLCFMAIFYSGCTYKTSVDIVKNVNIYSCYEEKIPGNFALIIDNEESIMDVEISPSTRTCWTDTYKIYFYNTFNNSIKEMNSNIFQSILEKKTIPSVSEMEKDNFDGYILIRSKFFEPRIEVISSGLESIARVTVGIGFDYIIRDKNNKMILNDTVSSERTYEENISLCSHASKSINSAVQKSMRDALERYGERISNSEKLREAIK